MTIDPDLIGAITFSDGINEGLPLDGVPQPAPAPADTPPADTPPTEHHSIIDTPVELPTPPKKKRNTALRSQLEGMYAMAGMFVAPFDEQTGVVIMTQAPACAEALDELAQKNPSVKAALESLLATSAWSAVIAAHLPIAVQLGTKYVPELRRRYSQTVSNHGDAAAAA